MGLTCGLGYSCGQTGLGWNKVIKPGWSDEAFVDPVLHFSICHIIFLIIIYYYHYYFQLSKLNEIDKLPKYYKFRTLFHKLVVVESIHRFSL